MNDFIKGQLNTYCELVNGGKPTAMLALQDRYVEIAKNIIDNQYKLKFYIEDLSEGWVTLWIYKESYMINIVRELPKQPKTIFEHWVLGKAFGYSEQSIKEFLEINRFV